MKWTGYDTPDWQDAHNMNRLQAVDDFHEKYPAKPGPLVEEEEQEEEDW